MRGKAKIPAVTHERVRDVLDYNPVTGVFLWKISPAKNVKIGTVAGGDSKGNGYRYIRVDGYEITSARLAIFYVTGKWPDHRVRFANGDISDCRFENLRISSGLDEKFDWTDRRSARVAYLKASRSRLPEQWKELHLRKTFSIGLTEYAEMHAAQSGLCAICGQPETETRGGKVKSLAVDHCHQKGHIRKLLCGACNKGLGAFKDDPARLRRAAEYLECHAVSERDEAA